MASPAPQAASTPDQAAEPAELKRRWAGTPRREDTAGERASSGRRTTQSSAPIEGDVAPSDDQERVLWSDTFSAKGLVNHWLALTATSLGVPIVAWRASLPEGGWPPLLFGLGTAWLAMVVWLTFLKLDAHYVLTTQRFLHKRGVLVRHTHRIEVIDIDDISFRQGILERLINVGSIEIISSDRSDPKLRCDGINHVHQVAHAIDQARRNERLKRGLHIEAV